LGKRGERNLTLLSIHAIARGFKIKISELIEGVDGTRRDPIGLFDQKKLSFPFPLCAPLRCAHASGSKESILPFPYRALTCRAIFTRPALRDWSVPKLGL
jgi:hypothetical protein